MEGGSASILWVIRHGDREDYRISRKVFQARMKALGNHALDPPLSKLGHQQARETAAFMAGETVKPDQILASPFLRAIQTAAPLADLLDLPIKIEDGLAEINYAPGTLATAAQHAAYFPQIDDDYKALLQVSPTPGHTEPNPHGHGPDVGIESFPEGYLRRMRKFAPILEKGIQGHRTVCFTHAASLAFVAALLQCRELEDVGKFGPCGIFKLEQAVPGGPWCLVSRAESAPHVSEISKTGPWDFGMTKEAAECGIIWRQLLNEESLDGEPEAKKSKV